MVSDFFEHRPKMFALRENKRRYFLRVATPMYGSFRISVERRQFPTGEFPTGEFPTSEFVWFSLAILYKRARREGDEIWTNSNLLRKIQTSRQMYGWGVNKT